MAHQHVQFRDTVRTAKARMRLDGVERTEALIHVSIFCILGFPSGMSVHYHEECIAQGEGKIEFLSFPLTCASLPFSSAHFSPLR